MHLLKILARATVHEYMHERRDRDVFYIREFGYLCVTAEIFVEHVCVARERERKGERGGKEGERETVRI